MQLSSDLPEDSIPTDKNELCKNAIEQIGRRPETKRRKVAKIKTN